MDQKTQAVTENTTTTSPSDEEKERLQRIEERKTLEHIELVRSALSETRLFCKPSQNFENKDVYGAHSALVMACANEILSRHGKKFILDDYNKQVVRFLMLYFNNSPLALKVFPDKDYSLDKNIMLVGEAGVGKTLIMDVFKLYLDRLHSPMAFHTVSQTQMLNHFKQNNNIDLFTFNTSESKTYEGKPFSLCLNDLGLRTQKFFSNDLERIIEEFLYARYEIWEQQCKATHITTNLDKENFDRLFGDEHGRLLDRLKMFNVIQVGGQSRR